VRVAQERRGHEHESPPSSGWPQRRGVVAYRAG
jgi:hypothetical protein